MQKIYELGKKRIVGNVIKDQFRVASEIVDRDYISSSVEFVKDDNYTISSSFYDIDQHVLDNINKASFSYDSDHMFFDLLLNLLNGKKELIIDDDLTEDNNKKYIKIVDEGDKVVIEFYNYLTEEVISNKFSIMINNTSSKTDDIDKNRLNNLFNELYDYVMNNYHQETIDEYVRRKERKIN